MSDTPSVVAGSYAERDDVVIEVPTTTTTAPVTVNQEYTVAYINDTISAITAQITALTTRKASWQTILDDLSTDIDNAVTP